jgi:hypothetical protein
MRLAELERQSPLPANSPSQNGLSLEIFRHKRVDAEVASAIKSLEARASAIEADEKRGWCIADATDRRSCKAITPAFVYSCHNTHGRAKARHAIAKRSFVYIVEAVVHNVHVGLLQLSPD